MRGNLIGRKGKERPEVVHENARELVDEGLEGTGPMSDSNKVDDVSLFGIGRADDEFAQEIVCGGQRFLGCVSCGSVEVRPAVICWMGGGWLEGNGRGPVEQRAVNRPRTKKLIQLEATLDVLH